MGAWQPAHSGFCWATAWQPAQLWVAPTLCMAPSRVTNPPSFTPAGVWHLAEQEDRAAWWQETQVSLLASWYLWSKGTAGMPA